MLIVADLHFEKGSSYARRGQMLPPYDTTETLAGWGGSVARLDPVVVIVLGDSFHDDDGAARLSRATATTLRRAAAGPRLGLDRRQPRRGPAARPRRREHAEELVVGPLVVPPRTAARRPRARSPATCTPPPRVPGRARRAAACFADGALVLPAFGAYAGGLNVLDRALPGCSAGTFRAFMLGEEGIYPVGRKALRPD